MDRKSGGATGRPSAGLMAGKDGSQGSGDVHFDRWLEEKLRGAYSSVLDEPVPDELLRLLHQKLKD